MSEGMARISGVKQIPLHYKSARGISDFPGGRSRVATCYKYIPGGEHSSARPAPRIKEAAGRHKISATVTDLPGAACARKTATAGRTKDKHAAAVKLDSIRATIERVEKRSSLYQSSRLTVNLVRSGVQVAADDHHIAVCEEDRR